MKITKIHLLALLGCLYSATFTANAETFTYKCQYTHYSNKSGYQKVSKVDTHTFIIDTISKNAYLNDGDGTYDFVLVAKNQNILAALVQVTPIGNVNSATISKNLDVVYSRNTMLFETLSPTQYYGKCQTQ